jgi:hypothetical protein
VIASAGATIAAAAQPPSSAYRLESQPKTAAELEKRFSAPQIEILEMLNRRDSAHLVRPDPPTPGLVVPITWSDDPLTYSPFPATWPAAEPYAKAIVVDQPAQAFGAYERGRLVRWGPVSTGRKEKPRRGLLQSRAPEAAAAPTTKTGCSSGTSTS